MKVGIIGVGMVGGAIKAVIEEQGGFKLASYDKYKAIGKFEDVLDSEICFVSVPTPTDAFLQDLRPLIDVLLNLSAANYAGLIVVKCTVLPGTMGRLAGLHSQLKIMHNPEFLTERNAMHDFKSQSHVLLSCPDTAAGSIAVEFYNKLLPKAMIALYSDYKTTELAKYLHNCFLATKVSFMNEFYDVCQKLGADYDLVSGAAKSQGMIGLSHLMVPGPDGQRGFGGSCFPKDTSALAGSLPPEYLSILRAAMSSNRKVRND